MTEPHITDEQVKAAGEAFELDRFEHRHDFPHNIRAAIVAYLATSVPEAPQAVTTQLSEAGLAACPFCGGKAIHREVIGLDYEWWVAGCEDQNCAAEIGEGSETLVVAAWNRRIPVADRFNEGLETAAKIADGAVTPGNRTGTVVALSIAAAIRKAQEPTK